MSDKGLKILKRILEEKPELAKSVTMEHLLDVIPYPLGKNRAVYEEIVLAGGAGVLTELVKYNASLIENCTQFCRFNEDSLSAINW